MVELPDSLAEHHALRMVQALEAGLDDVDAAWLARIESAQQANPRDTRLQYLAGMACAQRQLWGKAQQLLTQAAPKLRDTSLREPRSIVKRPTSSVVSLPLPRPSPKSNPR